MSVVHAFGDDCLGELDAVGVAAGVRAGAFSPAEALEAALARIDRVEPELNAVAYDDRDRARERLAEPVTGALGGVPSIIKNNTAFAGLPTRQGSAAVTDRPATANEPFADQFCATGVSIVGASTMPAFGLTATTEFVDREPTRNPWHTGYSAGASSGGSAALVAAGALPIAHANDGGGSIRIPAAACGLVGLKSTRGRLAPAEVSRSAPIDLVCNGIVSRSVRDTAHFLAEAERIRPAKGLDPVGLIEGPQRRRLRIAVINAPLTGQLLDRDTNRSLDATVELLEALGHRAQIIPIPVERAYIRQFTDYWALMAYSLDHHGKRLTGDGFDRSQVDPFTRGLSRRFLRGFYRAPSSIIALKRATKRFRQVFQRFDLVLSPTLSHVTPEIGYLDPGGDFDEIFDRLIRYVSFTPIQNSTGTPAISLPLAQSSTGLPIGMQFSADLGDEAELLHLAYELEAAQPFARIQDAAQRSMG